MTAFTAAALALALIRQRDFVDSAGDAGPDIPGPVAADAQPEAAAA